MDGWKYKPMDGWMGWWIDVHVDGLIYKWMNV